MSGVDLLHIGFHKTGTTWLQQIGFLTHPDVKLVNDEASGLMRTFIEDFVEIPSFQFDEVRFKTNFLDRLENTHGIKSDRSRWLISEENLSGHFWNAGFAEELLGRLQKTFGDAKILIVIRRQDSMLKSLYSNYVKQGGHLPLSILLQDGNFFGRHVIEKLAYDRLIDAYKNAFGNERVMVQPYEFFVADPQGFLNQVAAFIDAAPFPSVQALAKTKVNVGLSSFSEAIVRVLNGFGSLGNRRGIRKIPLLIDRLFGKFISDVFGKKSLKIPSEVLEKWRASNRRLGEQHGIDLKKWKYLT